MAQSYAGPIFDGLPDWARVPIARLESFHWEGEAPYRPASFAQLCAVRGKGVFVRMWSFEEPVRAVACERDDPVYKDSCLECFLNPFPALENGDLDFEMNPKGVFLAEFGPGREGRVRLSKMTDLAPVVTPFSLSTPQGDAWGVLLLIPVEQILKTGDRVVEIRNRLMQAAARIIREHLLEGAEGFRRIMENNRVCDVLAGIGIGNKIINTPAMTLCILIIGRAVYRAVDRERFPLRISARRLDLPAQIGGHAEDILHELIRIVKDMSIDLLQQEIPVLTALLEMQDIGIVDMPVVNPVITDVVATQRELALDLLKLERKLAHVSHTAFLTIISNSYM